MVVIESGIFVVYLSGIGIYHEKATAGEFVFVTIVDVPNNDGGHYSGNFQWCCQY